MLLQTTLENPTGRLQQLRTRSLFRRCRRSTFSVLQHASSIYSLMSSWASQSVDFKLFSDLWRYQRFKIFMNSKRNSTSLTSLPTQCTDKRKNSAMGSFLEAHLRSISIETMKPSKKINRITLVLVVILTLVWCFEV